MRYRLKLATWTVVREPGQPSPRLLSSPEAAALLAVDLMKQHDDDKEHFWAIFRNAQNHYLMHTEISVGTLSASLVHPREVLGLPKQAPRQGAVGTATPSPRSVAQRAAVIRSVLPRAVERG